MDSTKLSVPLKGLQTDLAPQNLSEDQYSYALNATYEDFNGDGFPTLQNEKSNILTVAFDEGYKVIGQIYIVEQDRAIYLLVNNKQKTSRIVEILNINSVYEDHNNTALISFNDCVDCEYEKNIPLDTLAYSIKARTVIEAPCLNFNENYPVDLEYKLTDCTLELYFVDKFNPDRYAYFDYDSDSVDRPLKLQQKFYEILGYEDDECKQPIYSDRVDCEKLKIQPDILRPQTSLAEVDSGGSLRAGVYQFLAGYASATGEVLSSYYGITNIIPIKTLNRTFETNYITDRSITLEITGLSTDTVYQYYNLVVAETIDNFTEYKLVGTFPVTQNKYTYTGNDTAIKLTENDILQKYPYYRNSKSITKANNYLFRANLEEYTKPNLQRIAKYIDVYWETVQMPEGKYREPEMVNKYRSFMRDEVYALALIPEGSNGEDMAAIHLPGRKPRTYDTEIIGNADVMSELACNTPKRDRRWQVYNTATILETPHNEYDGCNYLPWEWGEFSYWESTELYPNNPLIWGDLCGKPIRHHKFPDSTITHIHDGLNGINGYGENNMIYPIGIRVDHKSVVYALQVAYEEGLISLEEKNRIKSYRVVRANRVGNKSVIAKGLLYDVWSYKKKNQKYYYPNYPYNDMSSDIFLASNDYYKGLKTPKEQLFTNEGRYTFHSPDTHFVEPSIGTELKLETTEYGFSRGFFNEAEGQAKHKLLSRDIHQLALAFALIIADAAVDTKNDGTVLNATLTGLKVGATVGSAFPGWGTVIGIVAGTIVGLFAGLFKKNAQKGLKSLMASLTKMAYAMTTYQNLIELFKSFVPFHNYTIQYNSIGKYNNYVPVFNDGNKVRAITEWNYLKPEVNSLSDGNKSILFNNFKRESSVYIKTDNVLPPTPKEDLSRVRVETAGCVLNSDIDAPIASYYASIKNNRLNQYGNIFNIQYLETNGTSYYLDKPQTVTVFGGDIFINRFALKRKHAFFIADTFKLPNETDWYYSDYVNAAYPRYYFNTQGHNDLYIGSFLQLYSMKDAFLANKKFNLDIRGFIGDAQIPNSTLDCLHDGRFNLTDLTKITTKGWIYLYSYGIPYFLVESDVNVDYRHAQDNTLNDFYPNQTDLTYWLQPKQETQPIDQDNTFHYNKTYSKQIKESFIYTNDAAFEPSRICKVSYPNRVIYSQQSSNIDNSSYRDNWLTFKANSLYNFPLTDGRLVSVEGIENDKILVRFENTTKVFNAYNTLQTNADTIQVDTGGMFQSKPQEYAHTTLGYAGSQHRAILHTEYGHIMTDAKRGQVINISGEGLDEISKNGMKNWFKENLPFKIVKDFPELDEELDNTYKGIGITMAFDKRFNRFFLTKLDYRLKDKRVKYNKDEKYFYIDTGTEQKVTLSDSNLFDNASWTLSYNFHTKSWVSYHSYLPNYYMDGISFFLSGVNNNSNGIGKSSLWSHNVTNKSYQTYYGKLHPFIIELVRKFSIEKNILNNINYNADVIRYHNQYDKYYNTDIIPFNRAVIYNNNQTTGLLEFEKKNYYDLSAFLNYPKIETNKSTIEITNKEGDWKFNNFYDVAKSKSNNIPLFLSNSANSYSRINYNAVDYNKPDLDKNRLRGDWFRFRLINDTEADYKIIMKYLINKSNISAS
jgi:hypothetical protein